VGAGCGVQAAPTTEQGRQRLEQAVTQALDAGSFRVEGELRIGVGVLVGWRGFVDGADEQYVIRAQGLPLESRRVDGSSWARPVDPPGPWRQVAYDGPFDLEVPTRGVVESVEHDDDWSVTLRFQEIDVLSALAHIPSTGPTTARITIEEAALDIELWLGGQANATVTLTDFGAVLDVRPVPLSASRD
jgi:hypothetical protein